MPSSSSSSTAAGSGGHALTAARPASRLQSLHGVRLVVVVATGEQRAALTVEFGDGRRGLYDGRRREERLRLARVDRVAAAGGRRLGLGN